jgi:arylsulfate sulfotransferase
MALAIAPNQRYTQLGRTGKLRANTWLLMWSCLFLVLGLGWGCASNNATPPNNNAGLNPSANSAVTTITPFQVVLLPSQTEQFTQTGSTAGLVWAVNGVDGGSTSTGTISSSGLYTAPAQPSTASFQISIHPQSNKTPSAIAYASLFVPNKFNSGTVATTNNPQVARYSLIAPQGSTVQIAFGTTTNYGLTTWAQPAPASGGPVSILVAGMLADTTYHMQAVVKSSDGSSVADADHVFTTGSLPNLPLYQFPQFNVTTPSGLTPQPGIELLALTGSSKPRVVATDLAGNVIWWYLDETQNGEIPQPIKMLPNGDFLIVIGPVSSLNPPPPGSLTVAREIDLAGDTIKEIDLATLNTRLAAANFNLVANFIHHDIVALPNGHWIILVALTRQFVNLPGYPGTTTVLGDALVDLDENLQPVWVWNSFDHLDINRHPYLFPDWTHSNAILYSPDDGNLLLSMRHQNWLLKIDYQNGNGAGDIVWRVGEGGDFTLQGGTDPTDWFYAQHGPAFTTPNTTGNFSLVLFDNGDDREFPPGVTCGSAGAPPCLYSTVPILQINESAKTANLAFHYLAPTYSFFGGNAEPLDNGDIEFDECALAIGSQANIYEVTNQATPQIVWHLQVDGNDAYRGFRLPSLYPGVQW